MKVVWYTSDATPHQPSDLVLHLRNNVIELERRYVAPHYRAYVYRLDLGLTDWKPRTIDVVEVPVLAGVAWKVWVEVARD